MPVITPVAVGGVVKLGTAVDSYMKSQDLQNQLKSLQRRAMPRYSVAPQIENLYSQALGEASAPRGFGGAVSTRFRQGLAQNLMARLASARTMTGGSGARGVNAVLAGQEGDALSNFAAQDEAVARANRGAALGRAAAGAQTYQSTQNQNTAQDINYRMMLERALGESLRSQRDYTRNMVSGLGSDLMMAGVGGAFKTAPGVNPTDVGDAIISGAKTGGPGVTPGLLTQNARIALMSNPFAPYSRTQLTLPSPVSDPTFDNMAPGYYYRNSYGR